MLSDFVIKSKTGIDRQCMLCYNKIGKGGN